jgi:hypothetical protein
MLEYDIYHVKIVKLDCYVVPPLPFLFLRGGEVRENESEQREEPRGREQKQSTHMSKEPFRCIFSSFYSSTQ